MALGSDTCRHILQTGLLNCGLEHTSTELRNVHSRRGALVVEVPDECGQSLGPDI